MRESSLRRRQLVGSALGLASSLAWAQTSGPGSNQPTDGAYDQIMRVRKIIVAVPPDQPPYGFMDTDFSLRGLDVDMARYIASKLGVQADLVPVVSANRIPYLQSGKVQLVISTLGKNPEREKQIDFAAAYSPFFQAVFGPKTLSVRTAADLSGKTIAVTKGALEDIELTKLAPPNSDIRRMDDNTKTASAFVAGQAQLVAMGASAAGMLMVRNPKLDMEYKLLIKDSPNYVGVAKGEDRLRLMVNGIIAEAKKSGELDRLARKWLGRPAGDLPL